MGEVFSYAMFGVAVLAGAAAFVGGYWQKHHAASSITRYLGHVILVSIIIAVLAIAIGIAAVAVEQRRNLPPKPIIDGTGAKSTTGTSQDTSGSTITVPAPRVDAHVGRIAAVVVPAGSEMFGCTNGDQECAANEFPTTRISFGEPFRMTKDEITGGEYAACVTAGRCADLPPDAGDWRSQTDLPVAWVDGDDANEFCHWVGGRLPNEAEWEYAARGGRPEWRYPWGNTFDGEKCVFAGSAKDRKPSPVGARPGNEWGLHDMAGNVAEWCYVGQTTSPGETIAVRGGDFDSGPSELRVSAKTITAWGRRSPGIGFRCVAVGQ